MLLSGWPGLKTYSPCWNCKNTMCLQSSRKRGFSKWPSTLQMKKRTMRLHFRRHFIQISCVIVLNLPDIFKHIEHLRRKVRVGHVKFCKICLQYGGRRLLGLQCRHFLLKAQDPANGRRRGVRSQRRTVVVYDTKPSCTFWQCWASSASFWGVVERRTMYPPARR